MHHGACDGGLAAAGLADEPDGLPRCDVEADAGHGVDALAALRGELDLEVLDPEQGAAGFAQVGLPCPCHQMLTSCVLRTASSG
ncbi:hypothetical protein GCM10027612_83780 [Microbispora bryophytorum subsp. camponoti]